MNEYFVHLSAPKTDLSRNVLFLCDNCGYKGKGVGFSIGKSSTTGIILNPESICA
jgi:hypothetical protein